MSCLPKHALEGSESATLMDRIDNVGMEEWRRETGLASTFRIEEGCRAPHNPARGNCLAQFACNLAELGVNG